MEDCVFCKIIDGKIPSEKVYEDENVLAFKDINPVAPIHILVIPKKHIEKIIDVKEEDSYLIAEIFKVINKIVKELNIEDLKMVVATKATLTEVHNWLSVLLVSKLLNQSGSIVVRLRQLV